MRIVLLLALVVVGACDASPRNLAAAQYAQRVLQIDTSACRAATNVAVPTYSGGAWALGASTAIVRCPLPMEAADYVDYWHLYGVHRDGNGQVTTACLQQMELSGGAALTEPYTRDNSCGSSAPAVTPGEFDILVQLPPLTTGIADDATLSIAIHGSGIDGDVFTGLSVGVQRWQ